MAAIMLQCGCVLSPSETETKQTLCAPCALHRNSLEESRQAEIEHDHINQLANNLCDPIKREYRRLHSAGIAEQDLYKYITCAVEFLLVHTEIMLED